GCGGEGRLPSRVRAWRRPASRLVLAREGSAPRPGALAPEVTSERGLMARRIVNRMDKRAEYEAYEASQRSKQEDDEELDEEEEEEDDQETEAGDGEEVDQDEEELAPKKKKAVKPAKPRSRARTAKVPRLRVI